MINRKKGGSAHHAAGWVGGQDGGDGLDGAFGYAGGADAAFGPLAAAVYPDAGDADGGGAADVGFGAVTDQPGATQPHPGPLRGDLEDARVGLAAVDLLRDHPVGDEAVQAGTPDLRLLL